ncbi:MAG TPA: oligosaccharide flippase family protein, partial [Chitinophagales bacterium]|nr:oligosaccharide flippase family protein [Chitinophagales bacterium]
EYLVIAQFTGYTISALIGVFYIRKIKLVPALIKRSHLAYFLSYGKFTSGSMIMGSLLRNADIFMIDAFLGKGAVAIYSAAQKTVEIFEVALRGVASHALPEFCKCADDIHLLAKKYSRLVGLLMAFFLPVALIMFIFSDQVIHLLSGSVAYSQAAVLLRIFMVYVFFLVIDRMTGVTLEALGLAHYNLYKTSLLVIVNITGNAMALYFFHSLEGVAAVSIAAALTGITSGFYFIASRTGLGFFKQNIRTGFNFVLK